MLGAAHRAVQEYGQFGELSGGHAALGVIFRSGIIPGLESNILA